MCNAFIKYHEIESKVDVAYLDIGADFWSFMDNDFMKYVSKYKKYASSVLI